MMKIVTDDNTFILPIENSNINVIEPNIHKEELLECLSTYFVSNKKTKCLVYDDGNVIKGTEIEFIYVSDDALVLNNLELKTKSMFNVEISKIIAENPNDFLSIDRIRENMHELLTDSGMYKLRKVLSKGINKTIGFKIEEFNIYSLLSMLSIWDDNLTMEESKIVVYNLLIYLSNKKTVIIYIDKDCSSLMLNWIETLPNNVYILIENNDNNTIPNKANLIILSNKDHLIVEDKSPKELETIMYMLHPVVRRNIHFQIKENIDLASIYYDNKSTFFLKPNY